MKYGEELKFLGGLYEAVRNTYNETDSLIQFENKINIAIKKNILSETTAYGIKKILPQHQKESIENLIDSIMNDDEPFLSHSTKNINIEKFGEELKYLGKLYSTIEKENLGRSEEVLMKHFAQKIDVSVTKGFISSQTAQNIKKMIEDRDIDELINSVMKEETDIKGKKHSRTNSREETTIKTTPANYDPCCHSSYGRSSC